MKLHLDRFVDVSETDLPNSVHPVFKGRGEGALLMMLAKSATNTQSAPALSGSLLDPHYTLAFHFRLWFMCNGPRLTQRYSQKIEDPDALANSAFVLVLDRRKLSKFNPAVGPFSNFASRVFRNQVIDVIRPIVNRIRRERSFGEDPSGLTDDPGGHADLTEESEQANLNLQRWQHTYGAMTQAELVVLPPTLAAASHHLLAAGEKMSPADRVHLARLIDAIFAYRDLNDKNNAQRIRRKQIFAYCIREVLKEDIPSEQALTDPDIAKHWDNLWDPIGGQPPGNFTRWIDDFTTDLAGMFFREVLSEMREQWTAWVIDGKFPCDLLDILDVTPTATMDQDVCLQRAIAFIDDASSDVRHRKAFALCSLRGITPALAAHMPLWEDPPTAIEICDWDVAAVNAIISKCRSSKK